MAPPAVSTVRKTNAPARAPAPPPAPPAPPPAPPAPAPSSPRPPRRLKATDADKKRKQAEEALQKCRVGKKPRKSQRPPPQEKTVWESVEEGAKYFKRCIDPFLPILHVILEGVRSEGRPEWAEFIADIGDIGASLPQAEEDMDQQDEPEQQGDAPMSPPATDGPEVEEDGPAISNGDEYRGHCIEAWQKLKEHTPAFIDYVNFCVAQDDHGALQELASQLSKIANQMRHNDNDTLKKEIHKLVSPNVFTDEVCVQSFDIKTSKAVLGIANDVTLELHLNYDDILRYRDAEEEERA
ncbi:hypothetical protein PQX77_022084, partial [Marasmius sp. AFHP31]